MNAAWLSSFDIIAVWFFLNIGRFNIITQFEFVLCHRKHSSAIYGYVDGRHAYMLSIVHVNAICMSMQHAG